eukprot:3200369-Pyramimonas_sp.AAC.1
MPTLSASDWSENVGGGVHDCTWIPEAQKRDIRGTAIGRWVRYIPIEGLRLVDDHLRIGEDRYGVPKGSLLDLLDHGEITMVMLPSSHR